MVEVVEMEMVVVVVVVVVACFHSTSFLALVQT